MTANKKAIGATDAVTNKRILALVKPEYMKRIPFFVRKHATEKTCELIAEEFPELYQLAKSEETFTEEAQKQMENIINDIFEKRIQKHHM